MKKFLRILTVVYLLAISFHGSAQCGAGYTQAQLNWDRLDYYYNSGSNVAPYGYSGGNYITNAMEQTQRFAIGRNYVTINTSAAGIADGENASHTGDVAAGYTGEDAQFTPSANNQVITFTFNTDVQNLQFTLYDVDGSQSMAFSAKNAANVSQNINVVKYASSILTINNNNATNANISASGTTTGNSSNTASATITVSGSVKTFTITITNVGSDAVFWLSDINACVLGSFPNNYNQSGNNRPLQGPAGNQPDYFIVTPDNNSAYMVDPATGNAWKLFTDASKTYINSFAYDPYHHYLYYISENVSVDATNHELKRYDFNTGTSSVLVADITTTLGIPTMGSGVESAGAAFYDGALYLGIEGGKYDVSGTSNDRTRETIFWRIDLDASQNPTVAYQVFATDAYIDASNTSIHDFGDFIIKNGVLYSFNTARNGSNYGQSKYHQIDLTTGSATVWNNPGTSPWNGQAGMTWTGDLYYFRGTTSGNSGVGYYDGSGNNSAPVDIVVVDGSGAWPGGAGDASENFRPQVDFGDAPASYDPNPLSPAAHAQDPNLRLGTNQDKEWVTKGQTALANSDSYDDGLPTVHVYNPAAGAYFTRLTVFNNTGANATVCAWLDYNANGVFDASEGISVTVPTSASNQQVDLYWPGISSSLTFGSYTYLRIRITYASNGMTTANPTGYYNSGEVEDYRVSVNTYPLAVQKSDFSAKLSASNLVKLNWSASNENDVAYYSIEKSNNGTDWVALNFSAPKNVAGIASYETEDLNPLQGVSYYRLKTTFGNGSVYISNVKKIEVKASGQDVKITPNPASSNASVMIHATSSSKATIQLLNAQGSLVYTTSAQVNAGENSIDLPIVSTLAGGRYNVRVITGTGTYLKTLIINR
jgi:hypothetical protein